VRIGFFLALFLLSAPAGWAAAPWGRADASDARRFDGSQPDMGLSHEVGRTPRARRAVRDFNEAHRGRFDLRFGPRGIGVQSAGKERSQARDVAMRFLREHSRTLGLDPGQLRLELARSSKGLHHLLFQQVVDGVPVEFSRVKVHLDSDGEIVSMQSSFRPGVQDGAVPAVAEARAAAAVAADLGVPPPVNGGLVHYPLAGGSVLRLAWKFRASGRGGAFFYYVDAVTGELLFRYGNLQKVCLTSGTVTGTVYDRDPNTEPRLVSRPMAFQRVYVQDSSTYVVTNENGFFCHEGQGGKIFTALQGPYVHVGNFVAPAAHYDNGSGTWDTYDTAWSSPAPYPTNSVVIATISVPAWKNAVKVMPRFAAFDVGQLVVEYGELILGDNDQVAILDANKDVVATYIGNRTPFNGTAVAGSDYYLRLKTNASGSHNGFTVNISSFLTISNPTVADNATATFTWTNQQTADGTRDEINVFYHLNKMHEYLKTGPNSGNYADLDKPVPAMVHVGPNLGNAFYDPAHGNLSFGDLNNGFAFDGTVVRHEYIHFAIDQIYPIINFGQFGSISEAMADYFSTTSFGDPAIGTYTNSVFGVSGPLRTLDCTGDPALCRTFPTDWDGDIYRGAQMLGQALWELRTDLISALGATNGKACSDGLVWQALFFFPDSLSDFLDALLQVDSRWSTLVPVCGQSRNGLIQAKLANHGIVATSTDNQDRYEPNDGIASATDITTSAVVTARLYPKADLDYYAFGAGPGKIRMTLKLPPNPGSPGAFFVHSMSLVNSKFNIVQEAMPSILNPTLPGGFCPEPPVADCQTAVQELVLEYDNPSSDEFFLLVSPPPGELGLVSTNFTTQFYELDSEYNRTGPVDSRIVTASFDNDVIDFSVRVTSFVVAQGYSFYGAQLRDHALEVLPATLVDSTPTITSPYVQWVSSRSFGGRVSGSIRLLPGFDARFPAVGTVHLEAFGWNRVGHVQSLGFSPPLQLTSNRSGLKAYNNIFNPTKGEKATFRFETSSAGRVRLRLFTLSGEEVITLLDENRPAGKGSLDWSGGNLRGTTVASGIYYLNLSAPGVNETRKVIVVK